MNHRIIRNRVRILFVFSALFFTAMHSALYSQGLNFISVSAGNTAAGSSSIHTINFTTTTILPITGKIVIVYPAGFDISPASIVTQTGMDGTLTLTKAGTTITLTRSGVTPLAGSSAVSVNIANVTNSTTSGSHTINIRTENAIGTQLDAGSYSFSVIPGALDHFSITGVPASVVVGTTFPLNIEAQDAYNNRATSFTSTVNLSDLTGTLSPPATSAFSSGLLTGFNVNVTKTSASNSITAISSGKSGSSSSFSVLPAALDHFVFGFLTSPKTAGSWFSVSITAQDAYYNNKTDFTGTVALSEGSGTLFVQTTGSSMTPNFTGGQWSGNIRITHSASNVQITASNIGSPAAIGLSVFFNVDPASVDHFSIASIGTQSAGSPFLISVTAQDAYNNTATSFTGSGKRVQIIRNGIGTISPIESGDFSNGIWNGLVSVSTVQTGMSITVNNTSGAGSGTSNSFNVISSTIDHFHFSSISSSQTAGSPFSITISAEDANNNPVVLPPSTILNLKDKTGTCNPSQIDISSSSSWTGSVAVTKSYTNNMMTVDGVGKSATSGAFNVNSAVLDHFDVPEIFSPKTAGTGFPLTLIAKDVYENTVTGFSGIVNIHAGSNTVSPTTSGSFTGGSKTLNVLLIQSQTDAVITVDDGSSHSGTSNAFNVLPGALNHFDINPIADQATGLPFVITVTAKDANDNTITSFSGAGNTVNITHSGSGAIQPTVSSNFISGVWIGSVQINQTQASDRITVTRTGGGITGISNTFNVSPSAVDHFVFSFINSVQTAGVGFPLTVTAQDANNNTVTSFSGTANLVDAVEKSSQQISMVNGVWNGTVTIFRAGASNSLTVTGSGKSSASVLFHVLAAPVNDFLLTINPGFKTAGISFPVLITARDRFGNTATGFTGTVHISDFSGSISPTISDVFSNGSHSQSITLTRAWNDNVITVDEGAGHSGRSTAFNVVSSTVDHFSIDPVGNQVAGVPFILTVTAQDRFNNTVLSFPGTVDLSDLTGTINPVRSTTFTSGRWSSGITINTFNQASVHDQITVVRTGGTETGVSTPFDVFAPPGVRVASFSASRDTVTIRQQRDWTLTLAVKNLSSSVATLDSLRLKFWLTGLAQNDYALIVPPTFKKSGTRLLAGNTTDTLSITVDRTGSQFGNVTVEANVFFTDGGTNGTVWHWGNTGIVVQDSARLAIERIRVSRQEVSRSQEEDWTVTVILTNRGGSTLSLDSSRVKTNISFGIGSGWRTISPAYPSSAWKLTGGERDSLVYTIDKTGAGNIGLCLVHASVGGLEMNTGRTVSVNTASGGFGTVFIENPASLQIIDVKNLAPNTPYVDLNQQFKIQALIKNIGGDGIHYIQVNLISDGYSSNQDLPTKTIEFLPGGQSQTIDFQIQASGVSNAKEIFTASATGFEDNTNSQISAVDDTTKAVVQNPAVISVEPVIASISELMAGQKDIWLVKVPVRNSGTAELELDTPQANNIEFYIENVKQTDYGVQPPATLKKGGLRLKTNNRDTLIYTVNNTGIRGGLIEIRANIGGKDRNSQSHLSGSNISSATILVKSGEAFRIISTKILCTNQTSAGDGLVNVNQAFKVQVVVENGLGLSLKSIQIQLKTSGSSVIQQTVLGVSGLKPSEKSTVNFSVTADKKENAAEMFTASVQGEYESFPGKPPIGIALDDRAQVAIQLPAHVVLSLNLSNPTGYFSTDQAFTVTANLNNIGTASIDNSGRVKIILPAGYSLAQTSTSDTLAIAFQNPAQWSVKAPSQAVPMSSVVAELYKRPNDKNSGNPVLGETVTPPAYIETLLSSLTVSDFSIVNPTGARDGVVSTGQNLIFHAAIAKKNANNVVAKLILPDDYKTADNPEKSALSTDLYWQVTAPSFETGKQSFGLELTGVDSLQENIGIKAQAPNLSVKTVACAKLSLKFYILEPADVKEDNTVSPEQEFKVRATLINSGTAGITGTAEVTLGNLPTGYEIVEPDKQYKQVLINNECTWTIRAPDEQTGETVNLSAQLTTTPLDENTNVSAYVELVQGNIPISIEGTWLAVSRKYLPSWVQSVVLPGQTKVKLMVLELDNRGAEGANAIVVDTLKMNVEDSFGKPISPKEILSELFITLDSDSSVIFGSQTEIPETNPVEIAIPNKKATIPTDKNLRLAISGVIVENPSHDFFQLNIPDSSFIRAKDSDSKYLVPVKSVTDEKLNNLVSEPKKIYQPDSEPVVWNYPNPFGSAGKEKTKISYYLKSSQSVSFNLYTLTGQLVWQYDRPAEGAGTYTVLWDGRNMGGTKVMNGVYLLFMKTADGVMEKTKIAVVK